MGKLPEMATVDHNGGASCIRKPCTIAYQKSAPIQIVEKFGRRPPVCIHQHYLDKKEEISTEDMIPPHILVAMRESQEKVSSVLVGKGRTLKGRDLQRFRNSVLQQTGFIGR